MTASRGGSDGLIISLIPGACSCTSPAGAPAPKHVAQPLYNGLLKCYSQGARGCCTVFCIRLTCTLYGIPCNLSYVRKNFALDKALFSLHQSSPVDSTFEI